MKNKTLIITFLFLCSFAQAQLCNTDELTVQVIVATDNWGYETSWEIIGTDSDSTYHFLDFNVYGDNETYDTTFCIPNTECMIFNIYDSYGDGIFSPGFFQIIVDSIEVAMGDDFGEGTFAYFNCPPGSNCNDAIDIVPI